MFLLMKRRPPRSTRTDTLLPYATLFRSKGGGRLGLDAGALGEIADHFVLERETPDRTAFGLRAARDRLQHRGLARARLSLARDRAIVRGEDQGRGGTLPGIRSEERRVGTEGVRTYRSGW